MFMRRSYCLLLPLFLLCACTHRGDLPPDEVIERSIRANKELTSVDFTLSADLSLATPAYFQSKSFHVETEGVLQGGGRILSFTTRAQGQDAAKNETMSIIADVIRDNEKTFLRFSKYFPTTATTMDVGDVSVPLLGTWWQVGEESEGKMVPVVTPDPSVLRLQAHIIDVVEDHGLVTMDGRETYFYDVQINKEKLHQFLRTQTSSGSELLGLDFLSSGKVWIDAENFLIHRLQWNVSFDPLKKTTLVMDFRLSEHDTPVTIRDPAGALPLPVDALFPINSTDLVLSGIE